MAETTHCFYVPGAMNIQDFAFKNADGDWCGLYSRDSEAALKERTGAVLTELEVALAMLDKVTRDTLCGGPARITQATFVEMLEVLPPQRWENHAATEFFHISEHISGPYVSWYVRIGEGDFATYYTLVEDYRINTAELLKIIHEAFNPEKAA